MVREFFDGDANDMDAVRNWAMELIHGKSVLIQSLDDIKQLQEGNWLIKL